MDTKMKKILCTLCIILMVGCTTTGQAYLPHTSRVFHAKKSCVGCYDPNPIVFQTVQAAANSSGIAPCSMCVKPKSLSSKNQGYTATNYATLGSNTGSSNSQKLPPAKSKSSVAARILGGILVTLGIVAIAVASSATPNTSYATQSTNPNTAGGLNTSSNPYMPNTTTGTYIGNLSSNQYAPNSTSNQYGAGSPYNSNSINNPYGTYGSAYSSKSANNPYATDAPKLYDSSGQYRGTLSSNPYDPDSVSNPYGKYGSRYSSDSINNPYGAGSKYQQDSPNNPYGSGLKIIGQ